MSESILLRFANEEMVYLLRSLGITDFPGLAVEPLKGLADNQKSLLLMEADHTLRARGLVRWLGEGKREIAPLVAGVLLECARPRYTLFVDMLETGSAATPLLYLFGETIVVEQSEPEPQVQQYLVMPGYEDFIKRLRVLMIPRLDEIAETLPAGQLDQDLWTAALKVARTDETEARRLLAGSLSARTAEALALAIRDHQHIRYLARWKQTPARGHLPEMALTIVTGQHQLFLLWQNRVAGPTLNVISTGADQVWEYLTRLIPPASTQTNVL
jgi:hypothetical protein